MLTKRLNKSSDPTPAVAAPDIPTCAICESAGTEHRVALTSRQVDENREVIRRHYSCSEGHAFYLEGEGE